MGTFLSILSLAFGIFGAVGRGLAASQRIDELLAEIDSATADLNISLAGTEADRLREISQADATLDLERTRILAQETQVAAQLATDLETRLREHGESEEEITRQLANLEANRAAAIEAAKLSQQQALESRELTVTNIQDRIAAGDIEAARKAAQITASRDQFLAQTRDEAIVVLNKHAGDALYGLTTAGAREELQIGQVSARIASSAVRRTGTPLLVLQQMETQAKAEYAQTQRETQFSLQASRLGYEQKVVETRTKAEQSIEDVMAENLLFDTQMQDQIEQAQLDFTHTYANLEASQVDINRAAAQEVAAQQAKARNEEADYQADVAQLNTDAANAKAALESDLAAAVLATSQRKEDVIAQADVLTAHYRQQLSDLAAKKTSLTTRRSGIIATAVLGGVPGILTSTQGLIDSIRNQQRPGIKSGGGATMFTE